MVQSRFWCLKSNTLMTLPDVETWRMALEPAEFRAATHTLRLSAAQSTPYRSAHPGTATSRVLPLDMVSMRMLICPVASGGVAQAACRPSGARIQLKLLPMGFAGGNSVCFPFSGLNL